MKIVKSPFTHKIDCYCSCKLHYKDSDVIAKINSDEKHASIVLATNEPLWERLKEEFKFYGTETAMLKESDAVLHIYYKYVNHYVKCPFCGSEVQIRPVDKDKHDIWWEAIITKLTLAVRGRDPQTLYMWYHTRIQWLVDEGLLSKDFLKNNT